MIKVTNKARSARGVHDVYGRLHMLAPGETKSLKLSGFAVALLKKKGSFALGGDVVIEGIPADKLYNGEAIVSAINSSAEQQELDELEALRADAESVGVKVDGRWGAERIRSEIDKALSSSDAVHNADSE